MPKKGNFRLVLCYMRRHSRTFDTKPLTQGFPATLYKRLEWGFTSCGDATPAEPLKTLVAVLNLRKEETKEQRPKQSKQIKNLRSDLTLRLFGGHSDLKTSFSLLVSNRWKFLIFSQRINFSKILQKISKNPQECLQKSSKITQNSNSPFSSRRSVRSVPCFGIFPTRAL